MEDFTGCLTPSELSEVLGGITIHGVYKALKSHNISSELTNNRRKKIPPAGIRKLLTERGFEYPKMNISFQIVKGGVGKTSLSYALGLRASHYGTRVLLIDLDQQGNLTRSFNVDTRSTPVWVNIIRDNVSIDKAVVKITDTLHIIPSNLNNSRLDVELTQSSLNLRDMVRDILIPIRDNYDLVIMDCPPAINKINLSAACASDMVIIPLNPEPYAMEGLDFTLEELKKINKEFKLNIDIKIVWNRYDARERLGTVYMHAIAKDEDKYLNVLPVVIRVDASLKNSIFDGKSIFDIAKKTGIRDDFDQFTKEILGINQWSEKGKNIVSRTEGK